MGAKGPEVVRAEKPGAASSHATKALKPRVRAVSRRRCSMAFCEPPYFSAIWRASEEYGSWSLTSLQQSLVKTGGRLVKHARYYWLMLAEGHLTRARFAAMLRRIALLPLPAN